MTMGRMFLCAVAATALLFATMGVAAAQGPRTTTATGSLEATVMVQGQPVQTDVKYERTGPPQNEIAGFIDALRATMTAIANSIELDRRSIKTAGMMCFRNDTGEKILCFPPPHMMTASAPPR